MDRDGDEVFREARLPNCYLHLAWARRSYLDTRSPVSVRLGVGVCLGFLGFGGCLILNS